MPDSPLSNPSSSLSPPPQPQLMLNNPYNELGDSDSELSALTEDEGDADESGNKNALSAQVAGKDDRHPAGTPKGSSASAALATAGRKIKPDVPLGGAAGASGSSKAASKNASSSRRKRNSIVPAPMWGWAEVKNAPGAHAAVGGSNGLHGNGNGNGNGSVGLSMSGSASASSGASGGNHTSSTHSGGAGSVVEEEEEEEEEVRGPPKAMEEEEEDDDAGITGVGGSSANGSGHGVAGAGGDGEKTSLRRRARVSRSLHAKSTRQKGGSGSSNGTITGPGGEVDPATSDADLLSASEEGVEESAPKRSGRRTHRGGGGASRKKERIREDADDDYVAEGNDSEPGSRKPKKVARRPGAGSSSKRDPKTKDAYDTHHGSDDDEEHRQTTRKTRHPKYRRDYRLIELGQCTDTDDDYVWSWDAPPSPSTGYHFLKRMRRMTTEEIARRDKRKAKGEWVTAKKRRPPRSDDAEESRESPLSDIDYAEDMKSSSMDATAPSAREIGHIAVVAAASSIMAGSGTYVAPSSDSDTSGSATPPRKGINHNTSPTAAHKSPLVSNRMPPHALHASTEQIRSPVSLQMTSGASPAKLTTSPSSARRQAAEALGVLAQEGSPTRKTGGSPGKSKPTAVLIVAEAMEADISVGEQQGSPIEENPTNDGGADEDDQEQEAELVQEQEADQYQEPEPEQDNEQDAEPEQEQEQDPDQDQEGDQDQDQDQDQEKDDDLEVDLLESDLQPAHRAEALDVLASIELKFALLRERVYVEKMEGLAWEEELVVNGSHPELLHLHKELTKRKAKRLELAFKKRDYEIVNAKKRRRVDEDAVWSWWMHARDELQTDMIAETNRKRRRLERERRAFERPQSVRRIPQQSFDVPLVPPSLRKILKSFPFGDDVQEGFNKKRHSSSRQTSYPEVTPLSTMDVASDVDLIFQQRRQILNAGLPPNQSQLTPASQLTPTLYDVPAPLYGGHHILGPARPGPGVGIIGPGGMGTLPPGVGVGVPVGLNHMGGIGGVGMVIPNAPLPGMGVPPHQHSHVLPHGPPPPHSAHQHQQQMQVHPHQHSHPRPHQHPHHSHPHQHQSTSLPPGPPPPGPPPPGYGDYPEGGPGIYGPGGPGTGPGSGGRGMGGAPPPPPISQSASAPGYQQHVSMHASHNVHPRDRDRNRERERERDRDREREREHPGDMSPFASSYGGSNGPAVTGGPGGPPTAVAGGGVRPNAHGPPGYGRGHGYRDAEYEFEQQQQQRERDRDRDRDRERERDRDREREQQRPSSSQAQLSLPHHSQQQQTGAGTSMPPGPGGSGGVMMIQPPYYGTPRDTRDAGEMHGYPHNVSSETSGRREGREMLEGRERDAKDPRDAREAHDMRDGGRRSISPVNVGGPPNQSWTDPGVWYGGRNEGRNEAMDIDDDERVKERERRERERNERETDRDRERDVDRDYQQEMGKRDYHVQQMQHQHRHAPSLQHQHVHPGQHNHHHSAGSHHHHHHHHVLHRHHGQRPTSTGPAGHGTSSSPPSSSGVLHSPQSRDYDVAGRPLPGPGQLSTEAIQHTTNKPSVSTHWKADKHLDHRERERERETQSKHGHPGMSPEERDRPLAMPFVMTSSHAMPSTNAPPSSSGQSFSTGPSQGTHGSGGASPRSGWLRPEDLDRERGMGRERDIERERERDSDRIREKERDWERDREMEREGDRERVREREREKDRERDPSYRMGAPPPASSAPPGFHGALEGHRYPGASGSGASLLSRSAPLPSTPQQGSLPNPAVAHSPPRSRQVPLIYPRSPTRYGPPPGGSHMSSAAPGSASPVSGSTTGPGQPPPPLRSPTVNTKIRPSSPLVHLVNKPLGGPSLPSSTTGSPKGAGGTAFSPPPLAGHGSPGVYSPRAGNMGSRPLSPRDSRKYGGSPTLPSISAVPGASTVTRSGPVFLEREREREREASPTATPASLSPIPPTPHSGANTSLSSSKMSVPQMLDGKE